MEPLRIIDPKLIDPNLTLTPSLGLEPIVCQSYTSKKESSEIEISKDAQPKTDNGVFTPISHEIYIHLFGFLDVSTLKKLPLVCWTWSAISKDEVLWQALFKRVTQRHERMQPQLTWRISLLCYDNLLANRFKVRNCNFGEGHITSFRYNNQGLLILEKTINNTPTEEQKQLEVWNVTRDTLLHRYPFIIAQRKENCWGITATLGALCYKYTHLGDKPTISLLTVSQDKVVVKINHLSLFIMSSSIKEFNLVRLLDKTPLIHALNLMNLQQDQQLWVREESNLRIYDPTTIQWRGRYALPDSDNNYSAAKIGEDVIILTNKKLGLYKDGQGTTAKSWEVANEKGWNQKIIIPRDDTSYFGVYENKTLTLFDTYDGKTLGQFASIPTDKILLTAHTVEYLNDKNELVVHSFGPN